jgi:3-methyladenine DNA glycosylase AlkD
LQAAFLFEGKRFMMQSIDTLCDGLHTLGNPEIKAWWEGYVKDANPFLGVKMPVIRKQVNAWVKACDFHQLDHEDQLECARLLLLRSFTEEKLAGTLLLQEHLLNRKGIPDSTLAVFADLFDQNHLNDWNICDWFCMKVLGPGIALHGDTWAMPLHNWDNAENLWRARASLVAFVKVADNGSFYPRLRTSCARLIVREERFAKTAVGWILREIYKYDAAFTENFVDEHLSHFTIEVINNALKYAPKPLLKAQKAKLKRS